LGEPVGKLASGPGVQVALGGRDARLAHRRLNACQIDPASNEQGTVGVSQVVESQGLEADGIPRSLEAPAQRRGIEAATEAVALPSM